MSHEEELQRIKDAALANFAKADAELRAIQVQRQTAVDNTVTNALSGNPCRWTQAERDSVAAEISKFCKENGF
jgi:hypothetical protein